MLIPRPNSDMGPLLQAARNNRFLSSALSQIDGLDDINAILARLYADGGKLSPKINNEVAGKLSASLAAGHGIPDDFVAECGRVAAEGWGLTQAVSTLEAEASRLTNERDYLIREGCDTALRCLNTELVTLLDSGRDTLTATLDLSSGEDAIGADRVEEWKAAQAIRKDYAAMRAAQSHITRRAVDQDLVRRSWEDAGYIANVEQVWELWPAWKRFGRLEDAHGNTKLLELPWPSPSDDDAFLTWLITDDTAEAWVPDSSAFGRRAHELRELITDPNVHQTRSSTTTEKPSEFKPPSTTMTRNPRALLYPGV